jgi:hypothetical protein
MRSAPLIRARIYSYLYYGMKRFSMHAVVDIILLLLHASLLLFFAGLIAFLIPVNFIMAAIAATWLRYHSILRCYHPTPAIHGLSLLHCEFSIHNRGADYRPENEMRESDIPELMKKLGTFGRLPLIQSYSSTSVNRVVCHLLCIGGMKQ